MTRHLEDLRHISLVAVIALIFSLAVQTAVEGSVVVAEPNAIGLPTTEIGEGKDFATHVLGLPWDMSEDPYPDFPTTFINFERQTFSSSGGIWNVQTSSSSPYDPNIFFHDPGIAGTQQVLRLGDRYPIDADVYHLLSFRMCSDTNDLATIFWYLDQFQEGSPPRIGNTADPIAIVDQCMLYVIDLKQINISAHPWSGLLKGFRLDPGVSGPSANIDLDWIRLTTADITSNIVPIDWTGVTSGTELQFSLNFSCDPTDAMPIGTAQRSGQPDGTFNWGSSLQPNGSAKTPYPLPESFQPGTYRVLMQVDGGPALCAPDPLTIRQAPVLTFEKPSLSSGPDYSIEVAGDAWDMSNPGDIILTSGITQSGFSNGIWDVVTNAAGDPWAHLNVTGLIDASKYKYATIRMWLEAQAPLPQRFVSVHRWVWWTTIPEEAVTVEDMLIYEGWHTYSYDLSTALIDPVSPPGSSWSGNPKVFRLDIHEELQSIPFHLDYVKLTGDEIVLAGTPFPLRYQVASSTAVTTTFYYDTDQVLGNGRTPMVQFSPPPPPPSGPFDLFLPLVMRDFSAPGGESFLEWAWDTAGIASGAYYVSVDVSDGFNTTTWYSEVPVLVTN